MRFRQALDYKIQFEVNDRVRVRPDYPDSWGGQDGYIAEIFAEYDPPTYRVMIVEPYCDPVFESTDLISLELEEFVRDCF